MDKTDIQNELIWTASGIECLRHNLEEKAKESHGMLSIDDINMWAEGYIDLMGDVINDNN